MAGPPATFTLNTVPFVFITLVLYRWKRDAPETILPAERFFGAFRVGLRYFRESPPLIAVVVRMIGFFLFASAAWALLPLVARGPMGQGPVGYGILLGAIGAGAVTGAVFLPRIRRRLATEHVLTAGTAAFAFATLILGISKNFYVGLAVAFLAGADWRLSPSSTWLRKGLSRPG